MATNSKKLLSAIILIVALALGFLLLKPFFSAFIIAIVFAALLYRPYKKLSSKLGKNISAGLLTILVLIGFVGVLILGSKSLLNELGKVYLIISKANIKSWFVANPEFGSAFENLISVLIQKAILWSSELVLSLPKFLLSLFVFTISLFYFLKDGEQIYAWFKKVTPLPSDKKQHLFEDLEKYFKSFIKVWLFIGLLQALVAVIGFLIFGLPAPILAGICAGLLSILPIIGPYAIYLPVIVILILSSRIEIGLAFGAYGLGISAFLDYVVRPYYTGKWAAFHPLFVLIGTLGGVILVGPVGVIVGPALMIIIVAFLHTSGFEFGHKEI